QLQPFTWRQVAVVAKLGDRHAADQFHDEIRPWRASRVSGGSFAAIEDASNINMVHHRQRLPFGFEAGDHLAAVHTGLDDLESDFALPRLRLLGHEAGAHAASADLLQ